MSAPPPFDPKEQLDAFLQALHAHDPEQALAFLAEDFRLEFVDYGSALTKEQTRAAFAWDTGTNGHVHYENLEVDGHQVTAIFTETNDFLRLVGIPALQARITYVFDAQGRITEQRYTMLPDQPSFQAAMQPAVAWAATHQAEELAEIYPDNQMIYSREMAERWVRLLKAWHQATKTGPA